MTLQRSQRSRGSTSGSCATLQAKTSKVTPSFPGKSSAGQASLRKISLPLSSHTASIVGQASSKKTSLPSSSHKASSAGQASSKKTSLPSSHKASTADQASYRRTSLPSSTERLDKVDIVTASTGVQFARAKVLVVKQLQAV